MSIPRVTDADLVARAREGDTTAFGELVDRHRSAVYRAALAALGSHAEADDAAQDACVLAYRRLHTFRGDASFKTWLLTIAWHQAINRRRRITRWVRRMVSAARAADDGFEIPGGPGGPKGPHYIVSAGVSPEALAATRELRRAIGEEIRRLSPALRDALLLAESGEYRYEEIAAMLAAPVGTIKWRVAEARRVLKARLKTRGFTDVG